MHYNVQNYSLPLQSRYTQNSSQCYTVAFSYCALNALRWMAAIKRFSRSFESFQLKLLNFELQGSLHDENFKHRTYISTRNSVWKLTWWIFIIKQATSNEFYPGSFMSKISVVKSHLHRSENILKPRKWLRKIVKIRFQVNETIRRRVSCLHLGFSCLFRSAIMQIFPSWRYFPDNLIKTNLISK